MKIHYHSDHLGSASFVTDIGGNAVQHLQYLPYGELFVSQRKSKEFDSRYKFTAKALDNETSYTYFGARYYDSELSGWLSVDPISDKYPSTSAYMYCSGNPVILRDPNGMDWVESENGDITWRNDINKDNYSDLLKEGEIYRGITYARTKEWNNNRYQGAVVEVYRSDGSGLDYYTPNEFGMYRFPESGRGFERYTNPDGSNNGNNENYYINNKIQHADNYISGTAFANFYNTIQDFYNETGITIHYGDISAYDPSINLGHTTHFQGNSIDIHYFDTNGNELRGPAAYSQADIRLTNIFFNKAQNNGFTKNYSFGSRFTHMGNNNQIKHKDHLHIGL